MANLECNAVSAVQVGQGCIPGWLSGMQGAAPCWSTLLCPTADCYHAACPHRLQITHLLLSRMRAKKLRGCFVYTSSGAPCCV